MSLTGFAKNALIWMNARRPSPMLFARREAALERLRGLLPGDLEIDLIRHHGDLHLGQILVVKDDACIIDFEGEPNRTASERPQSALGARRRRRRAFTRLRRNLGLDASSRRRRKSTSRFPRRLTIGGGMTRAFLAGVREAAGPAVFGRGTRRWPIALRFFVVEKAFYEIGYELANRPDWVVVPLAGAVHALFHDGGDQVTSLVGRSACRHRWLSRRSVPLSRLA